MIEIADHEVPSTAAALTVAELLDGMRNGTLRATNGDIIMELRDPATLVLRARIWLGRDGSITPHGLKLFAQAMADRDLVQARILWIAKQERLH